MTDGDALLAAICAHPYDDTPRLAYADWLDENGGKANTERAEFIRLQVELHAAPGDPPTPARDRQQRRERALLKRYRKRWEAPLIGKGGPLFGPHTFTNLNRGFVDRVGGTAANWVANGDAVFRLAPITNAGIDDLTEGLLRQLLACEWAKRPDTMEMSSAFEFDLDDPDYAGQRPPHFAAFAEASLPNLKFLWFSSGILDPRGALKVARANPMPNIETLQLSQTELSTLTVQNLFRGPAFASLRDLYLGECDLGTAELAVLARSKVLKGLKQLALPYQQIDGDGLEALTGAVFWPTLRRFEMTDGRLGPPGLAALAVSPSDLEELELESCHITPAGIRAFTGGDGLRNLTELSLGHNALGDDGAVALTQWPGLARVKTLHLGYNEIGPTGAKALAACPALAGLKTLFISGNPFGDAGWRALANSPHLGGLEWLYAGTVTGKRGRDALTNRFGDRVSL